MRLTKSYLIGELRSDRKLSRRYKIIERDHFVRSEWWGGYTRHNKLYKKVISKRTDEIVKEEFVAENHAIMTYSPLLDTLNLIVSLST